jgi:hypothetical protein
MASRRASPNITATLDELFSGKARLGHNTGDERKVSIVKMTPVPHSKELVINGLAQGTSLYTLTMNIFGVDYSDTQDKNHPLMVDLGDGYYKAAAQIPFRGTRVQIKCSCSDFYFTWSHWDSVNKALAGPHMAPYHRKTTYWPERNPSRQVGMCKHLMSLVEKLIQQRIIIR